MKLEKVKNFASRYVTYTAMRMLTMGTLYVFVRWFELTELVDIDKMSIFPTFTETMSIYSNLQSMLVILARGLLNLSHHSEYITSVETLYALYKMFVWQNDKVDEIHSIDDDCVSYGLLYCWYSLMIFAIKKVLVWAWNMNEGEWPAIVNNPSNIRAVITLQQMDQIEFNSPYLNMTIGIFVGMTSAMVNYDLIFRAIKQWCYTKITAIACA